MVPRFLNLSSVCWFLSLLNLSYSSFCIHCDVTQDQSTFQQCLRGIQNNETRYIKCNSADGYCFTSFSYNITMNRINRVTRGCMKQQVCRQSHKCTSDRASNLNKCLLCCDKEYCNSLPLYQLLIETLSKENLLSYSLVTYEFKTVTYKHKYLAFVGLFILSAVFSIALLMYIFHRRKPKTIDLEMKHEVLTMENVKLADEIEPLKAVKRTKKTATTTKMTEQSTAMNNNNVADKEAV